MHFFKEYSFVTGCAHPHRGFHLSWLIRQLMLGRAMLDSWIRKIDLTGASQLTAGSDRCQSNTVCTCSEHTVRRRGLIRQNNWHVGEPLACKAFNHNMTVIMKLLNTMQKNEKQVLTTEMRCNGSKPCQAHIKRQDSERNKHHGVSLAHCIVLQFTCLYITCITVYSVYFTHQLMSQGQKQTGVWYFFLYLNSYNLACVNTFLTHLHYLKWQISVPIKCYSGSIYPFILAFCGFRPSTALHTKLFIYFSPQLEKATPQLEDHTSLVLVNKSPAFRLQSPAF